MVCETSLPDVLGMYVISFFPLNHYLQAGWAALWCMRVINTLHSCIMYMHVIQPGEQEILLH